MQLQHLYLLQKVVGLADKAWRREIFKKYKHKCDICGSKKIKQVHHLESYANNKHLTTDINNGACLCQNCHVKFHKQFGFGNNTIEQYNQFKEESDINKTKYLFSDN